MKRAWLRAVMVVVLMASVATSLLPGTASAVRLGMPNLPYLPIDPPQVGDPDGPGGTKAVWQAPIRLRVPGLGFDLMLIRGGRSSQLVILPTDTKTRSTVRNYRD